MGLNTEEIFNCNINEGRIKTLIDNLYSSGLIESWYKYINIDNCWQSERNENEKIVPYSSAFPNGINSIVDYVHKKGLLFGLYSEEGSGKPGSLGNEVTDTQTYAEWSVDDYL